MFGAKRLERNIPPADMGTISLLSSPSLAAMSLVILDFFFSVIETSLFRMLFFGAATAKPIRNLEVILQRRLMG